MKHIGNRPKLYRKYPLPGGDKVYFPVIAGRHCRARLKRAADAQAYSEAVQSRYERLRAWARLRDAISQAVSDAAGAAGQVAAQVAAWAAQVPA